MRERPVPVRRILRAPFLGSAVFVAAALVSSGTQTAVANGDTRTIRLYHAHTKESIEATYRVNGQYDPEVLKQLNWFLRDWRHDEPTSMDPRLFDVVWEVYRTAGGGTEPVTVMSAYRSPETNAMLRRRSRAVAEHSQHMLGKAMDTSMPGMSMEQIREIGMRLQRGGVGYYPTAGTPFVHLDVGSVRSWPRMPYEQLARLFPDGKTVHLPSNGQPLARYEEARAEIAAQGSVAPPSSRSTGFFAWLFGGGTRDGDDEDAAPAAPPTVVATAAPRRGLRTRVASLFGRPAAPQPAPAPSPAGPDDGGRDFYSGQAAPAPAPAAAPAPPPVQAPTLAAAEANLPRGETVVTAAEVPAPRTVVASLSTTPAAAASESDAAPLAFADHPAPPRRPADLITAIDVPMPPVRPIELAALGAARLPAGAIGYAGLEGTLRRGPDPIGTLLAHGPDGGAIAPLRAARVGNGSPIVPVRLDRSNFRAMTTRESAARMTTQTVSGPTLVAARSAARAQRALLTPADGTSTTAFGTHASALSTSAFRSDGTPLQAAALGR